jgi:hypothetical protein
VGETRVVRKQYHFWPGEHGVDAWDVDRLIELRVMDGIHGIAKALL